MYCPFCSCSLPKDATFCFQCGQLVSNEQRNTARPDEAPTFVSSPPPPADPYRSYLSNSRAKLPSEEETQSSFIPINPYAPLAPPPPPHRRPRSRFLKGFFIGIFILLLLTGGGLGAFLFRQGAFTPKPHPTAQSTPPAKIDTTPTMPPAKTNTPTTPPANMLYAADWSSGFNGWDELPGFQDWKVESGMLHDDGTNSGGAAPGIEAAYEVTTPDYAIETEFQAVNANGQPCFDLSTIRTNSNWIGYKAVICNGMAMIRKGSGAPGDTVALASAAFDPHTDWHTYRLEAQENTLRLLIDGKQILQTQDSTYTSGGKLGLNSFKTQLNIRSYEVFAL